ncbi:MAG: alcohol dehydrogenase [Rhodobacteraceae bacterium]|nr:alcohol dehydrogenase [Paracoccaceae bacterium]MAY44874.1 alcohol dehydrogenase [Paracoccaceae bacterium]
MKAAIVRKAGEMPVYDSFEAPIAGAGECTVDVIAAALSPLARARASGAHYSSTGQYPFVAGVDGVGTLEDGRRVYFVLPRAPFGAMAERTVVSVDRCVALPDGLDPEMAAALANPGMSSWAALTCRADLKPGETVLINGATGASGQLAVKIARHLGAATVIATGRSAGKLDGLGADATILLGDDAEALEQRFAAVFAGGVDVVVDYLWGMSAERMLMAAAKAGPQGRRLRFVQVGNASGANIALPGAVLRSAAIELMGSGIGSVPFQGLVGSIAGVFGAAQAAGLTLPIRTAPLAEVAEVWPLGDDLRTVFRI